MYSSGIENTFTDVLITFHIYGYLECNNPIYVNMAETHWKYNKNVDIFAHILHFNNLLIQKL